MKNYLTDNSVIDASVPRADASFFSPDLYFSDASGISTSYAAERPSIFAGQTSAQAANIAPVATILPLTIRAGSELLVNKATANDQNAEQITALTGGGFVVTWTDASTGVGGDPHDTSGTAIKLQVYAADGSLVGNERLANTATLFAQNAPQITALSNGGFVVTWTDNSQSSGGATGDGSGTAVKAQIFAANGTPVGSELRVNSAINNNQNAEQITALGSGMFVVTWVDNSAGVGGATGDGSGTAIKAQVFSATGGRIGTELLVNTATAGNQTAPQITALSDTIFVVTWTDASTGGGAAGDGLGTAIKAQVISFAGVFEGPELLVNTAIAGDQNAPHVTALSDGVSDWGFAITWTDASLGVGGATGDTAGTAIKAQKFYTFEGAVSNELLVNTATAGNQRAEQIAGLSNGGFVIIWTDPSLGVGGATGDTSGTAIKAQIYDKYGDRVGTELLVNTATAGAQSAAQITALTNGGFVVTWTDASAGSGGASGDASGTAIKAQVYAADGSRMGSELLVNTATAGAQSGEQVKALANGGFVITWEDSSAGVGGATGDASGTAIKAQVYSFAPGFTATEQVDTSLKGRLTASDVDAGSGMITAIITVGHGIVTATAGTSGATVSGSGTASVTITGTVAQVNALLSSDATSTVVYNANSDAPPASTSLSFTVDDGGNTGSGGALQSTAVQTIAITAVNDAPVVDLNGSDPGIDNEANFLVSSPGGWKFLAFIGNAATITDVDSADFNGGTLTFSLNADPGHPSFSQPSDQMGIFNYGAIPDHVVVNGNVLSYNGTPFATFTGGTNGTDLVVTLTAGANAAEVQALIQQVEYDNTDSAPQTTDRHVGVTLTDGDGGTSVLATTTIHIQPAAALANQAPAGTDGTVTVVEDGAHIFTASEFGFTDGDGNALAAVEITTLPTAGTLTNNGTAVTAGQFVSGTDIAAGHLEFTPAPDANGAGYAGFTFQVQDNGGTANGGVDTDPSPNTLTIDVTPVNDAPQLDLDGTSAGIDTSAIVDEQSGVRVAANATLTDIDSSNFAGGTLTISYGAAATATDGIGFSDDGGYYATGGRIGYNPNDPSQIYYDKVMIGTVTPGAPGQGFLVTFTANATAAAVQALIRSINTGNFSDTPPAGSRALTFTVTDGDGGASVATANITITPVNDAPVGVNHTVTLAEDTSVTLGTSAFGFTDAEGNALLAVKITTLPGAGTLALSGTAVAAGSFVAASDIAAGHLVYTPPHDANGTGYASFTFQVQDDGGTTHGGVDTDPTPRTLTVDVIAVDDGPQAVADTRTTSEAAVVNIAVVDNDTDVDGGPKAVAKINGTTVALGDHVTLASGAVVTLNSDGTLGYDPHDAFDYLNAQSSTVDHFSYTLNGGSTADVAVTVTGLASAGDANHGSAGDDVVVGSGSFDLSQGGNDTVTGGPGNDAFYFGAAFTAADRVDGGGGTNDQIGLQGDYTGGNRLVLGADTISNVEVISGLAGFSYDIATNDGNVSAGGTLKFYGSTLGAGDSFTVDGSAETDGKFIMYGGLGADHFTGGAGDDGFYFGRDGRFNVATDHIDGGAGTNDQLALEGDYSVTISNSVVTNVEVISLLDGLPTHSQYHITLTDDWTAAGQTHTVYGVVVRDGFTLDASAETDGNIKVYGGQGGDTITTGAGNDWISGGAGADTLNGGLGADTFFYNKVSDSIGTSHDTIIGFDALHDHIDLPTAVTGIDAAVDHGTLNAGSFDADLTAALAGLAAGHAVQFTADSGSLAGHIFEVIDTNGIAGYQAGQDMVIELQNPVSPITDPTPFI